MGKIIEFGTPKQSLENAHLREDAFTEPVVHSVILSEIDFELPDNIWYEINEGFEYFWNEEVGFGNDFYFDEACQSIYNHLKSVHILYSYDKLEIIMDIFFNFIEKIPGVFLDDNAKVIPRKRRDKDEEF